MCEILQIIRLLTRPYDQNHIYPMNEGYISSLSNTDHLQNNNDLICLTCDYKAGLSHAKHIATGVDSRSHEI